MSNQIKGDYRRSQELNMSQESTKPFTKEEEEVMQLIVEAHNKFIKLKTTHPCELDEWVYGIHHLQNILGSRVLRRDYPNYFTGL